MSSLSGKRILLTRAAEQCEATAFLIAQRGAIALSFPCLAVQCLPENIRHGMKALPENTAILLSSVNGVRCAAESLGDDFLPLFSRYPVIAVGGHTAEGLTKRGVSVSWVAAEASQEGLIEGFAKHDLPARVCFLRAEEGRDVLQQTLQSQGVKVKLIHAYRTICPQEDASDIVQALKQGEIDAVLLGSSRTARHYVQRIGDTQLANRPAVAVISPQVAVVAEGAGLSVQAVAKEASFAAMLDALTGFFDETRSEAEEKRP